MNTKGSIVVASSVAIIGVLAVQMSAPIFQNMFTEFDFNIFVDGNTFDINEQVTFDIIDIVGTIGEFHWEFHDGS
jgi:hypothetical protein